MANPNTGPASGAEWCGGVHAGLGIRKFHASGIWAARVGLDLRLVLALQPDLLTLVHVGSHDEVRRFLRSL